MCLLWSELLCRARDSTESGVVSVACSLIHVSWCHLPSVCLGGSVHAQPIMHLFAPFCLKQPLFFFQVSASVNSRSFLFAVFLFGTYFLTVGFHFFAHDFLFYCALWFFLIVFLQLIYLISSLISKVLQTDWTCLKDEFRRTPGTISLIVRAIFRGKWKEWGQLFTQMVYWWRCEAGQLTVGTQRLLFLVLLAVFKTTVFFSPPALSSFVCSGWHVWLFIVREKGVAGAINMWLHCIMFSTEKAVSFHRYSKQP